MNRTENSQRCSGRERWGLTTVACSRPVANNGRCSVHQSRPLVTMTEQLSSLPQGVYLGANHYTDQHGNHTLHLWNSAGQSFDIFWPSGGRTSER